jgi:hypothetical protein
MELHRLDQWQPGWVLARPARSYSGTMLAPAGTPLSRELAMRLTTQGLDGVLCVRLGEPLPQAPEHLDRFGPQAAAELAMLFGAIADEPSMRPLFAAAVAHAEACHIRYRQGRR